MQQCCQASENGSKGIIVKRESGTRNVGSYYTQAGRDRTQIQELRTVKLATFHWREYFLDQPAPFLYCVRSPYTAAAS